MNINVLVRDNKPLIAAKSGTVDLVPSSTSTASRRQPMVGQMMATDHRMQKAPIQSKNNASYVNYCVLCPF